MVSINENFLKLQDNYLFSNISKRVKEFQRINPTKKIIKMGIGDVILPIPSNIVEAMHKAVDEMGDINTFKGYPPEYGYGFLKEKIIENDYQSKGVTLDETEIFISDGAKSDTGNILDIFKSNSKVGITNPVYPVYTDTNVIIGNKIVYIPMNKENNFIPELPKEKIDIIYLCFPNNPTGSAITKANYKNGLIMQLKINQLLFMMELMKHI